MRTSPIPALLLSLFLLLTTPGWGQSQHEMNQQADKEFKQADKELNRVWNDLLPRLQPETREKLRTSQLQWIKFRDAEAAARASIFEGGSMAPMLYSYSLKSTTEARTKELKLWLQEASE
jgi:uncharacterized protein YecT (DUF1311 family)